MFKQVREASPLISVIIPIYKVEQYLDECIESIINQTYKNLEIILVDDGSPDESTARCDEWTKRDNRIRVIHKKNGGLSSARNAGLDVATGEYISFVDSDDFINLDALQNLYNRFQGDEDIVIVSGMIYRYKDGNINALKDEWRLTEEKVIAAKDFLLETLTQKTSHTVWNKLYRRNILDGVRFCEGRNNEDTLFMYDLGKKISSMDVRMIEIPQYVYYYRYREDSICTSIKNPLEIDILRNLEDMMNDCKYSDAKLYNALLFLYAQTLFRFVDSLLLNPIGRHLYFTEYQSKLRKISLGYIFRNFQLKSVLNIQLLKWMPNSRKAIRMIKHHTVENK